MIPETVVRSAILAALRDDPVLSSTINGVYDGAPARGSVPFAVIGDATSSDWGTKDPPGRDITLTLSIFDRAESSDRLGELAAAAQSVIAALPRHMGGWQIASCVPVRSRMVRAGAVGGSGGSAGGSGSTNSTGPVGNPWLWQSEIRLRVLRSGG